MAFVQGQVTTFPPPSRCVFSNGGIKIERERERNVREGDGTMIDVEKKRDGATDTWRIDGRRVKVASQHHRGQRQ